MPKELEGAATKLSLQKYEGPSYLNFIHSSFILQIKFLQPVKTLHN